MLNNKILIIEDEQAVIDSIKDSLEREEYDILSANNGKDGMEIYKKDKPILIILDLRMPVMDGIELLVQLEIKPSDQCFVIVLTGHGDDDDMERCFELGVSAFLRKPFNIFELIGMVKHCIALKYTQIELLDEIYEHKRAKKKAEHLASFPQMSINPILELNLSGIVTFYNNAAMNVVEKLGLNKNVNIFLPKDINEILKNFEHQNEPQLYREVEIEGQIFAENIHFLREFNVVRIYTRDITKRKNAEEEIRKLSTAVEQSPSIVVITNTKGYIEYSNPKFTKITGYTLEEVKGKSNRILKSGKQQQEVYEKLWTTITLGKEWRGEFYNKKKNGDLYWESASISPIKNKQGDVTHFVKVAEDVTKRKEQEELLEKSHNELEQRVEERTSELKISLREKELLLKEVHHRVKNNLQVVISLLALQARQITDQLYVDMFRDCQSRIESMALVHEKLYRSKDLSDINFKEYISDLTTSLFHSYTVDSDKVSLNTEVDNVSLEIDIAIPCGLVINELLSNALKYAFPGKTAGIITVILRTIDKDSLELIVSDNGIGIPTHIDYRKTKTLGLKLVSGIVEKQLLGTMELERIEGTRFKINFENRNKSNKINTL